MYLNTVNIYYKVLYGFSRLFSTWLAIMKYWPSLQMGKKCSIESRVHIEQLLDVSGKLRVIMNGNNGIGHGTDIYGSAAITFDTGSFCGSYCVFEVNSDIYIGKNVMIAQHVAIRDTDHNYKELRVPMNQQGKNSSPLIIEDDVWIGHGVIILKNVDRIGKGSIIAAGSVVTKNVPEHSIIVGVPGKLLHSRNI